MKGLTSAALALVAAFGLTGCDDDDDDSSLSMTSLQAVHASSDAPLANVWVNGNAALTDVDFGVGSGYVMIPAGDTELKVDVQLPGGDVATVIPSSGGNLTVNLMEGTKYTVFVVGDADGMPNMVEPLVVTRDSAGMADMTSADLQVVHAASGVPAVNLFVTAPGADLATSTPLAMLDYKDSTGVVNVAQGDYQVRLVTVEGDIVAFDSGTIPVSGNSELTIAAISTADSNSTSPVQLLVLDGSSSSIIQDTNAVAEVRVGHLVDGAPLVDVLVNDGDFAPLADLGFKEIRGYLDLAVADYDIDVFVNDTRTGALIDEDVMVEGGKDYSIYAVGSVTPEVNIEALIVPDVRRAVATSAVLNVTHAAANDIAAMVDVYLTATMGIEGSDPTLANFAYKESVQNVYVAEGDYYVTVTVAGSPDLVAIDSVPVSVANGMVYQVIAIDDANNGGFGLIVDDITD